MTIFLIGVAIVGKVITGFNVFNKYVYRILEVELLLLYQFR